MYEAQKRYYEKNKAKLLEKHKNYIIKTIKRK